jgi:hypothetical protein
MGSDWLSTGLQVAEAAANILGSFLLADGKRSQQGGPMPPYTVGTVQWYLDDRTGDVWAFNSGSDEAGLNYAVAAPESSLSVLQPLPPHQSYNAGKDFKDFKQGQLAVAPVIAPSTGVQGPFDRIITFTIGALALGVTARIMTGFDIFIGRDQTTGLYKAGITAPTVPLRALVKASDVRGNSVSAGGELASSTQGTTVELDIDLPPGVDLSPIVQNLTVELQVPSSTYEQATRERRALLTEGMPPFARGAAGVGGRVN